MERFTQRKFLAFPAEKRHKKCAELIREFLEQGDQGAIESYHSICNWIHLNIPKPTDPPSLADRYHFHLSKSGQLLQEHHFLRGLRKGDRAEGKPYGPIGIYLEHLRSAHNVGSIIRTTESLRLGTLLFSPSTPTPDHPQVKKTAMGADQWIEWKTVQGLEELKRPLIALETCADARPLQEAAFPESFTLALGNEEYGCSENLLKAADLVVEIPLSGKKNSLNVANAFAIAAYEISRNQTKNRLS